ncbi:hypothetical protein LIER_42403 [Lithospermum erythrorhizon]|uniref:Uncharacterized protein n=1 Tax=Lithospermum erythrorhizon TaxID=34254 RepID=A0AAV3RSP8_LITER
MKTRERSPDLPSKPMPYIGLYIGAASLICCIASTADVFNGFRQKKRWIPSKYFSINAATLKVLAVAMKLPMDITTKCPLILM